MGKNDVYYLLGAVIGLLVTNALFSGTRKKQKLEETKCITESVNSIMNDFNQDVKEKLGKTVEKESNEDELLIKKQEMFESCLKSGKETKEELIATRKAIKEHIEAIKDGNDWHEWYEKYKKLSDRRCVLNTTLADLRFDARWHLDLDPDEYDELTYPKNDES